MNVNHNTFLSIEQLSDRYLNQTKKPVSNKQEQGLSFQDILQSKQITGKQDTLIFSKHAQNRLLNRNIELTNQQMERLNNGARKAGEKGIEESLVIVDQLAFIVNVKNNTVVTAMDQNETTDNIFTNIDGAVII